MVKLLGWVLASFLFVASSGCSTAGPGLANHPLDCAIGIKWADCLPGTPGYNNGGGQQTRAEQARQDAAAIPAAMQPVYSECDARLADSAFDPIRSKMQIGRVSDVPPPFEMAANDSFPTDQERPLIARVATAIEECNAKLEALRRPAGDATPMQVQFFAQLRGFRVETRGRVQSLTVSLYQQKLTFGEYAQKSYEIRRDLGAAERRYREAVLSADQQRQLQAQQIAAQEFQNQLAVWSTFTQQVSARQPRSVSINCTSLKSGNMVTTNCN